MAIKRARKIVERLKEMEGEKANWLPLFQLCGEYVMSRKQSFTVEKQPGTMQTDQIFDDSAPNANALMAASLIGALWPNGAKSFRIGMPFGMEEELGGETEEVKLYYQNVTRRMAEYMDNPKSGFISALEEYMLDQGGFGISGIQVEDQDDYEVPLSFRAVDAKALYIDEGQNGFVNTVYIVRIYTVRQLVEKYGLDNVSEQWRKEFLDGKCSSKIKVLQAIEPRLEADPYGFGNKNMPYASIHIDIDKEKIMLESGFHELPLAVSRFWKAMGEKYGRCPAMNAMPSILEANAIGEAWILAMEKTLDPALLVTDDGTMGGLIIDTSPGAINVVSVSGRIGGNQRPIEPMFLVGDMKWTAERRGELAESIKNSFYQDRLTGLGKDERMQNPEVSIVNDLRGQSLNTVYSRQLAELFVPIIETTFNKLRRRGFLGVVKGSQQEYEMLDKGIIPFYIPEAVAHRMMTGQEVYKIQFISPATRIMQAEELHGIEHLTMYTGNVVALNQSIVDGIDWDWTLRRVQELDGAPREMIVSMERLRKIRNDRQKMAQAQMELEANRQNSETARNIGQATASISGSEQQGAA